MRREWKVHSLLCCIAGKRSIALEKKEKASHGGNTVRRVTELIEAPVREVGYRLWDIDFYKEGADYNLLITIEREERDRAVELEDCEKVSRLVSSLLDQADPISESYTLEVSSPGVERLLKRPEHFSFCLGGRVRVHLFALLDGKKILEGILSSTSEGGFSMLLPDGNEVFLEAEKAARVILLSDDE